MNPAHVGKFMTGAFPSPRHILMAAMPYRPHAAPPQFAFVPNKLSMWGNDQFGDCVTAESAFAKACHDQEIFIPDQTVVGWARSHGFLDGADLASVLDAMAGDGFVIGDQRYDEGHKLGVDWSNEEVLRSAISDLNVAGPVKIAIDSTALPNDAGSVQGWHSFGGLPHPNTDHCVSLSGYGPTAWLFSRLGVTPPQGTPAEGYLLFTWGTVGVVDHAWLMGTCVEAWTRQPTTVGVPPLPAPGPGPKPTGATLILPRDMKAGTYKVG